MDDAKLFRYSCRRGLRMYQRFFLDAPGVFPFPFSLFLKKNDEVDHCIENDVLRAELKNWEWLQCGQRAFSEAFRRNNIVLSSFGGWVPQSVTRFILVTRAENSPPELRIDADPSSIQYPFASPLLSEFPPDAFGMLRTISIDDIFVIKRLTPGNIKLVTHGGSQYVLKTIERQDEIQHWKNELRTLLILRDSSHVIDLIALVDMSNPYSPIESRVVTGFLLEYGTQGSLYEKLQDNGGSSIDYQLKLKWALEIVEGLKDMHAKGLVHGDIKPRNIIITETNAAKLIDFAGNGYSEPYHAPELHDVIARGLPWPTSFDIYSLGVLLQELISGNSDEGFTGNPVAESIDTLILSCLSTNPDDRPQISTLIPLIQSYLKVISLSKECEGADKKDVCHSDKNR
jgi:serine/threonine protein kinase